MQTEVNTPENERSAHLPIALISSIVRARAVRALRRHKAVGSRRGEIDPDVEDMVQEVVTVMLTKYGCHFHQWDATRGLSLPNFVGLVAERELTKILRSPRRRPWELLYQGDLDEVDALIQATDPESTVADREHLRLLIEHLEKALSPKGFDVFWKLLVEQRSVDAVECTTGLSRDAVYAWRCRLTQLVKTIHRKTSAAW